MADVDTQPEDAQDTAHPGQDMAATEGVDHSATEDKRPEVDCSLTDQQTADMAIASHDNVLLVGTIMPRELSFCCIITIDSIIVCRAIHRNLSIIQPSFNLKKPNNTMKRIHIFKVSDYLI
jgi:hypothetical protein